MNCGTVVIFDDEVKWERCPACGFGVAKWKNGTVKTNQWAGDTDPEGRNVWKGEWKEIPQGTLLIESSEKI